jgi:hypothetical protein
MRLASDQFSQDPTDNPLLFCNTETGWQEVSRGLKQVMQGYFLLLAAGVLGSYLVWWATTDSAFALRTTARAKEVQNLLALGVLALAVFGLGGSALILSGQWRCLMHAPQRQNIKELMLLSLNCVLLASLLGVAGAYVAGPQTYALLQQGSSAWAEFGLFSLGSLLVLGSACLGLLGAAFFAQFLRNVASCFDDRRLIRLVDANVGFLGLLVGGSVGLICMRGMAWMPSLWPWVGAGWLACFVWQAWLFARTSRCIEASLRAYSRTREAAPPGVAAGAVAIRTLSGLRRLIKAAP